MPIPLGLFSFYESLVSQAKKRVGALHLLFFCFSLKNFTQKLTMQGQTGFKSTEGLAFADQDFGEEF
jgi:hypothetical protein